QATSEAIDVEPSRLRRVDVGDPAREGEGQLLGGGRACLAHVIARDRDRVPAWQLVSAELEDGRDEPHRGLRRVDIGPASDVLLDDLVLNGPAELLAGDPTSVRDRDVERKQDGC